MPMAGGAEGMRLRSTASRSLRPRMAATSRARPKWPHRSGRWVMDLLSISMMLSARQRSRRSFGPLPCRQHHRDGLVVDLDDAVGKAAVQRIAWIARELDDAGVVLIDAQFGSAGQHAVALHPVDDLLADGRPGSDQARPAIGRAADHRPVARGAGIDERLHVVAVGDGLYRFHA